MGEKESLENECVKQIRAVVTSNMNPHFAIGVVKKMIKSHEDRLKLTTMGSKTKP